MAARRPLTLTVTLLILLLATAVAVDARCRADGERCRTDKQCCGGAPGTGLGAGVCVRSGPRNEFGTCCTPNLGLACFNGPCGPVPAGCGVTADCQCFEPVCHCTSGDLVFGCTDERGCNHGDWCSSCLATGLTGFDCVPVSDSACP